MQYTAAYLSPLGAITLGSGSSLTGYAGGIRRKAELLKLEGALPTPSPLDMA